MSTDDNNVIVNIPCDCGKGKITIVDSTPDHAYNPKTTRFSSIVCDRCSEQYTIDEVESGSTWLFDKQTKKRVRLVHDKVKEDKERLEWMQALVDQSKKDK